MIKESSRKILVNVVNSFNNMSNGVRLLIISISILLVLVTLVLQTNVISEKTKVIEAEKQELIIEKKKLSHLEDVKKNFAIYKERLTKLENAIPRNKLEEQLLASLYVTSQNTFVDLKNVRFLDAKVNSLVSQLPVGFNIESTYEELVDFLATLKDGDRLIKIDNISIKKSESYRRPLNVELNANAYYSN